MKTRVMVLRGKESKLRNFYPSLYKDEVKKIIGNYENGDIVDIIDEDSAFVARGYINENSNVIVRVLTTKEEEIDKNFFKDKIKTAYEKRKHLDAETNSIRVFYSEADGLPGLIVDKFDKYLSIQFRTLGIDRYREDIIKAMKEVIKPKGIYERSDIENRGKEGIEEKDYSKSYACSHKIKPTLDLGGIDLAYEENLQVMEWTKSQGKKKEIKEIFKSLKEHVDNALKEVKKDYNL